MNGIWPAAFPAVSPEIERKRVTIAQDALIGRARSGTFAYFAISLGYGFAITHDPDDLAATGSFAVLFLLLGIARLTFYRRGTDLQRAEPMRWRWIFGALAASSIFAWDCFTAFELWHRQMDATSMLLVASSLAMRASGTYISSPDRTLHQVFAFGSRPPIYIAALTLGTASSFVLFALLVVHAVYIHFHGRQLNEEFWSGVLAREAIEAARDNMEHQVAMRERAELDLRLAQKLDSVGRLAAGIAHEINTPLQAMMGNLHFVSEGTTELLAIALTYQAAATLPVDSKVADDLVYLAENLPSALELTHECLNRTATIVRSVKTFAHRGSNLKSAVDINRALATTLDISRHEYATVADIVTQFGELPLINGYAGELNHVLLNIVVNAAHAIADANATTGQRGVITVSTRATERAITISVTDTGSGIPHTIRDRIFDPFFTTKEVGKGSGQGLAIAHTVVTQRHGGELSFSSELGRGTTFTIRLPLTAALSAAA